MEREALAELLRAVARGETAPEAALARLRHLPFEAVAAEGPPFAHLDHHRALRQGIGEVVYCPGKEEAELVAIAERLVARSGRLLATRATPDQAAAMLARLPQAHHHERARAVTVGGAEGRAGAVSLLTAGTADLAVAEEARVTAEWLGSRVETLYDVGVAGLHRLLDRLDHLRRARVVVVAAGMDGVLASVVGGLVERPVVAVPTSAGYGAHFGGLA
ncbi:MAG: nickel pincer cofactor biosynthesis protein LarB, partial [Nitrospirae bacterium]